MFAKVIVDIAHAAGGRAFTYRTPEGLDVRPGHHVLLPFGQGDHIKEGFVLSYHNHSGEFSNEFKPFEGKTRYDHLLDELDPETVKFNLDAGWAQMAGMDVRALIERMAGRINIIHVKDVQANYCYGILDGHHFYGPERIEVGRGNMNYKGIIETAEKCGVKYFVVEDEFYSTGNPLESVRMSADYIKANLLQK